MDRLVRGLVVALLAASLLAASSAGASGRADARRAVRAYEAMQRTYFDRRSGGYRERPGAQPGAHAWPYSQALAATIAVASLPQTRRVGTRGAAQRIARLRRRFSAGEVFAASPGGAVYWDDNEWLALDLLDWYRLHRDPAALRSAERIFAAVTRHWDGDERKPCAGGVQWTEAAGNDDRNTVSTANGAVLGLRLYALTHRRAQLSWSRRMLAWVDACMRAPNGLYWDHIRGDGSVDRTQWSYNQGSVLAARLLLYRASGDAAQLRRAEAVADATLAHFAGAWEQEPPEFAAIFFRRLLALADVDGRGDYVAAAQAYADRRWAARDRRTALVSSRGARRLLDQAALVQLSAALAARAAR